MARHCEYFGEATRLKLPGGNGIAVQRGDPGPSASIRELDVRHAATARAGRLNATPFVAFEALLDSYPRGFFGQEREQIRMVANHLPRSVFFAKHIRGANRHLERSTLSIKIVS